MRLRTDFGFSMSNSAGNKYRGLKHVEVHLYLYLRWNGPLRVMECFDQSGGVEWLKNLGLQSVRFNVSIDETYEEDLKASLLKFMSLVEDEILGVVPKQK